MALLVLSFFSAVAAAYLLYQGFNSPLLSNVKVIFAVGDLFALTAFTIACIAGDLFIDGSSAIQKERSTTIDRKVRIPQFLHAIEQANLERSKVVEALELPSVDEGKALVAEINLIYPFSSLSDSQALVLDVLVKEHANWLTTDITKNAFRTYILKQEAALADDVALEFVKSVYNEADKKDDFLFKTLSHYESAVKTLRADFGGNKKIATFLVNQGLDAAEDKQAFFDNLPTNAFTPLYLEPNKTKLGEDNKDYIIARARKDDILPTIRQAYVNDGSYADLNKAIITLEKTEKLNDGYEEYLKTLPIKLFADFVLPDLKNNFEDNGACKLSAKQAARFVMDGKADQLNISKFNKEFLCEVYSYFLQEGFITDDIVKQKLSLWVAQKKGWYFENLFEIYRNLADEDKATFLTQMQPAKQGVLDAVFQNVKSAYNGIQASYLETEDVAILTAFIGDKVVQLKNESKISDNLYLNIRFFQASQATCESLNKKYNSEDVKAKSRILQYYSFAAKHRLDTSEEFVKFSAQYPEYLSKMIDGSVEVKEFLKENSYAEGMALFDKLNQFGKAHFQKQSKNSVTANGMFWDGFLKEVERNTTNNKFNSPVVKTTPQKQSRPRVEKLNLEET